MAAQYDADDGSSQSSGGEEEEDIDEEPIMPPPIHTVWDDTEKCQMARGGNACDVDYISGGVPNHSIALHHLAKVKGENVKLCKTILPLPHLNH